MSGPGFRLHVHDALASTQDLVKSLAEAGEPEGLAILARRQTAGRGTRGRQWESPAGNLHMSVLLRPAVPLRAAPLYSLLAAVALADALRPLLPDPAALRLKWPNDALLGGAKLAGILPEAAAGEAGALGWLVIGFGVNLAHAPAVAGRATASVAQVAAAPAPEDVAASLLARLAARRRRMEAEGFAPIRAAWLEYGPDADAELAIRRGNDEITGRFAGLGDDGRLLVDTHGRIQALASGEVV